MTLPSTINATISFGSCTSSVVGTWSSQASLYYGTPSNEYTNFTMMWSPGAQAWLQNWNGSSGTGGCPKAAVMVQDPGDEDDPTGQYVELNGGPGTGGVT